MDLNSNGIKDPTERNITFADNNGKYYFVTAKHLINNMIDAFPSPTRIVTSDDIDNLGATPQSSFGTNSGIYVMLPASESAFEATGHCDIWFNAAPNPWNTCGANCHWGWIDTAYFWKLN